MPWSGPFVSGEFFLLLSLSGPTADRISSDRVMDLCCGYTVSIESDDDDVQNRNRISTRDSSLGPGTIFGIGISISLPDSPPPTRAVSSRLPLQRRCRAAQSPSSRCRTPTAQWRGCNLHVKVEGRNAILPFCAVLIVRLLAYDMQDSTKLDRRCTFESIAGEQEKQGTQRIITDIILVLVSSES
jgi:hypothetical protein